MAWLSWRMSIGIGRWEAPSRSATTYPSSASGASRWGRKFVGCEHMFPEELKGLTPVEEKLIALNSCYGFITKYSMPDRHRQSARYPKHIKGYITVFPNNGARDKYPTSSAAESFGGDTRVLAGGNETSADAVEKALVWLKRHNPLYADIDIDTAELDSWDSPSHGVPPQVYERLERNEPSAWEKARTGQLVPPAERGLEDEGSVDIREVLATLGQGHDLEVSGDVAVEPGDADGEDVDGDGDGDGDGDLDGAAAPVHEISSSGMFALDGRPDVADAEKLRYSSDILYIHYPI
ncbi:hypothetical protein BKA56DRAFT_625250 [Ilyonectria sp. MPI-CAGE-AT-0026]|nr:hypothetical protein BKA56DRAFT_625250 [Ilyonectria sp. MPI-CAGE-AT-0026]